jgi:transcriptional regulator with XRE-family HTH domain
MSIKDRIIKKRKELGLNQTELAKRAGLKPPAISQYESGSRNPSYDAIIKLANALNVKVDYLVSGIESENNQSLDPISEIMVKILQNLSAPKKEEVIEFALLATGQKKRLDILSADPKQYARYIFEHYFDKKLPIDVYKLADKVDVKILKGELDGEAEAILLKRNSTIIIDKKLQHEARVKFAIATLIGHLLIPWHTEEIYYYRKSGQSTLLTDNVIEIEAGLFTTSLITPPEELEKDFYIYKTVNASLQELKKLADEKYKVSLNAFCNRLVEYYKDRFAIVISSNNKITKVFSNEILVKDKDSNLDQRSKAFELFKKKGEEEEFREERVPATTWLIDAKENELVYESSVFNPTYNSVLTLITKINKQ